MKRSVFIVFVILFAYSLNCHAQKSRILPVVVLSARLDSLLETLKGYIEQKGSDKSFLILTVYRFGNSDSIDVDVGRDTDVLIDGALKASPANKKGLIAYFEYNHQAGILMCDIPHAMFAFSKANKFKQINYPGPLTAHQLEHIVNFITVLPAKFFYADDKFTYWDYGPCY